MDRQHNSSMSDYAFIRKTRKPVAVSKTLPGLCGRASQPSSKQPLMGSDGGQGRARAVCHGPTGDESARSFQGVGLRESSTPRAPAAIRGAGPVGVRGADGR